MNLALPWSGNDHWPLLAHADQNWVCQCKLALAQPDPNLVGHYLVLALSGSDPGMVGFGCDWPSRALTLEGLAMLDLTLEGLTQIPNLIPNKYLNTKQYLTQKLVRR